jgi:hypothetical protein
VEVRAGVDGGVEGLAPTTAFRPQSRARTASERLARPGAVLTACTLLLAGLVAAGCGAAGQDAHEPKRDFTMQLVAASFPAKQSIARPTALELRVRNSGARTTPNVAVTLDSFYYTEHFPELAADKRPVWVVERGPGAIAQPPVRSEEVSPAGGGQTAYVSTWALGPLAPGRTQTFRWLVVPVKAGLHTIHFTVAAGLAGRARTLADRRSAGAGGPVQGQLTADIAPAPPSRHVDPNTGQVASGALPLVP